MDLFGRYVFRQATVSFLMILITLTAIVWLAFALGKLDLLTTQGQGFLLYLQMTGLVLPNVMALVAPIALLLACLYTLDRLNGDSELIVASAAGAPIWRFARPLLSLAALVAGALLVLNLYLTPLSMRTLGALVTQVRTDLISQVLQPGQFSSPERGLTFHIRDRDSNGDLLGLLVHDTRTDGRALTYLADRGRIIATDEGAFLVMFDGQIQRLLAGEKDPRREVKIGEFREYIFDITDFGPKTEAAVLKPRHRYVSELLYPDPDDHFAKVFAGKFRSELHERFASLLYPFAVVLITLTFLGQARTGRENRWKSIALAFGCAMVVRILGLAGTNLVTLHAWAVPIVYAVPTLAIIIAGLTAHARMSPYMRVRLTGVIWDNLLSYNDNFRLALGAKRDQQRGPAR